MTYRIIIAINNAWWTFERQEKTYKTYHAANAERSKWLPKMKWDSAIEASDGRLLNFKEAKGE